MTQNNALSTQTLISSTWRFKRGNGEVIAPRIQFQSDGSIAGYNHANERSWSLSDGCVAFHDDSNAITTRFTNIAQNLLGLIMSGDFLPGNTGVTHVLEQVDDENALNNRIADIVQSGVLGRDVDSYDLDRLAFLAAAMSASQYAYRHMTKIPRFATPAALLDFAASVVTLSGLHLEFGVFSGQTINQLADRFPSRTIYGFDSFEGLPEDWRPGFPKGFFATGRLPDVRPNVELVVGFFDRTLRPFMQSRSGERIALCHIDCDLYSSTKTVLAEIGGRIAPGTIIVFDEYMNYPGWEGGEFLAFQEYVAANRLSYEYIGLVPGHQQVAIRILAHPAASNNISTMLRSSLNFSKFCSYFVSFLRRLLKTSQKDQT